MDILSRIFYVIVIYFISIFARLVFRVRVSGVENIPTSGGVIVAANHVSFLDIPLLAYSLIRHANFIAKKELCTIPVAGTLLRLLGAIPIDREKIDRPAIREIIKKLNSGNVVVIYPEGTRSLNGKLQAGKPGVGFIVRLSGKKVVPAAIIGTDKAMPSGSWFLRPYPVTIRFGKPLDFSEWKEDVKITKVIMDNIAGLLDSK